MLCEGLDADERAKLDRQLFGAPDEDEWMTSPEAQAGLVAAGFDPDAESGEAP